MHIVQHARFRLTSHTVHRYMSVLYINRSNLVNAACFYKKNTRWCKEIQHSLCFISVVMWINQWCVMDPGDYAHLAF